MSARHGRTLTVLLLLASAPVNAASAQDMPVYRDDRSTPQVLVESLYNAISRHEYLRAWSYFDDSAVSPFDAFAAGYADTAGVRARVEEGTVEGAAGSLYGLVPLVIEATATDGRTTVFTGCYETRQVQPAAQGQPPFQPIRITGARLAETADSFADATGVCPPEGL